MFSSSGFFYVWGSIGGEIMKQFRYGDGTDRAEALRDARAFKADCKAGRRAHAWGQRMGIAEVGTDINGKSFTRKVAS